MMFFTNEEPWSDRTKLGRAELRYPKELKALCKNHDIRAVFYCDKALLAGLPELPVPLIEAC